LGLEDQHIRGGADFSSVAQCLTTGTGQRYDPETETLIPTRGGGFDVATFNDDGTARTLTARHDSSPCHDRGPDVVAFAQRHMAVRRLTPIECERLQGFPDGWTLVPHRGKPAADGPRYKALGNSMAVPCMRWIGERILMVEGMT
jgi:DNA (cytosine-5)-methyltransferase 1